MLETKHVMHGFTEIRGEFHNKCSIPKPLHELALWFTCSNENMVVHDWEDHKTSMVLAVQNAISHEWSLRVDSLTWGKKLILEAIEMNPQNPSLHMNECYRSEGYIPRR